MAVRQARAKARWRRVDAAFLVWDALHLDRLADAGLSFRTVVDSAMLHVLGDAERDQFVAGLGRVVPSGGRYCVLGDARRSPRETDGVTPAEIRERFPAGDREVAFGHRTTFQRRYSATPAYFVGVRRR